ncbi:DinI-like family protein [Shigella sonnei]|nr:DinI-like family protein [Shigella sonnei]
MRIEVTIAKTSPLPAGAIDILQETWESADDWFVSE